MYFKPTITCTGDNNQTCSSPHATNYHIWFSLWPSRHATFFAVVNNGVRSVGRSFVCFFIYFVVTLYLSRSLFTQKTATPPAVVMCDWCVSTKPAHVIHLVRIIIRFVCSSLYKIRNIYCAFSRLFQVSDTSIKVNSHS